MAEIVRYMFICWPKFEPTWHHGHQGLSSNPLELAKLNMRHAMLTCANVRCHGAPGQRAPAGYCAAHAVKMDAIIRVQGHDWLLTSSLVFGPRGRS